jgi:molybdate transport system ATP-binding protein
MSVLRFDVQSARDAEVSLALQGTWDFARSPILAVLGPSGGGKTSWLRMLAGLDVPSQGFIEWGAERWFDSGSRVLVEPHARRVGMLFQELALFPHLNVRDNLAFGMKNASKEAQAKHLGELIDLLELTGLADRPVTRLSGGQRQRVALGRVLAMAPELLLLDEPLSMLDARLRQLLWSTLRQLLVRLGRPVILVTHDREEAIALADGVAVLSEGKFVQWGRTEEVFSRPANDEVARLLGLHTVMEATVESSDEGLCKLMSGIHGLSALGEAPPNSRVVALLRAEDVVLERASVTGSSVRNHLPATVTEVISERGTVRVMLDAGFPLVSRITRSAAIELAIAPGLALVASFKATALRVIARR